MTRGRETTPASAAAAACRRLGNFAGSISLDADEVAEARWVPLPELRRHAEQHPEEYTQVGAGRGEASAASSLTLASLLGM